MNFPGSFRRFSNDQRAVSAVVGFILVFGILVLLLTVYQAQIVPQQNAQTEFEHFEDNKNEMIELRNAISTSGQADTPQFPSVTLGTSYQTRLLTINPAPPTGTLKTSEPYDINIDNGSHEETVSTRFLKYEPGYNELSIGTVWFENGVLYLDEREQSGFSVIEEQNLLRSNKTLRVNALQNEFSETGTDRVTLELYPTEDIGEDDILEGNLNVSLPTRLNESDYWRDAFEEDPNEVFDNVDESAFPEDDEVFALELNISADDLRLNTVGIQSAPEQEGEAPRQNVQAPTDPDSDEVNSFETLTAEADRGNIQDVEVVFKLANNGDVEIDIDPGESETIEDVGANEEQSATVDVDGNQNPVDVTVIVTDADGEVKDCEGTLADNDDFLTINPEGDDSEFSC